MQKSTAARAAVFSVCLIPAALLVAGILTGGLGANPIETLTHETGEWGLRFLLLTLLITPLRRLFKWNLIFSYRRMLGLFCFFYISLHFLIYLVFDQYFDVVAIIDDIVERPYITVGFAGFLLLIPLALTSFKAAQRKMGRTWNKLHKLVYLIGILGVIHFWWLVKADILEPVIYALILSILLGIRVYYYLKRKAR